ncbi:class I SAM-dependent methyltransferase [Reichenbachiella sp. MALMAid0571]|uniref:class I SAM-dependent methyltransferase n=1 Tax=Reichenbachiella sp. MALMAid0571 TaxID=3143939 RepID=UPI0032DF7690
MRNFTLAGKLRILNKLSKKKTLLDYGCGTGDFLKYCQSNNWNVTGIEINKNANQIAKEKIGDTIFNDINDIDKTNKFDIITLWHVLEHIHDLKKVFKKLKNKLTKSGHLIVALPNHECLDQKIYKEYWAAYDVPRHLYHFNRLTFNKLASKMDMKVVKIIPMKFDSYYVSLLSEKYKSGSTSYIKSFINGWKSNRWASKNGNNYSSLIYILKQK